MSANYLCHLANIIDIQWSRLVGGRGGPNSQLNWLDAKKCGNFEVADKHDAVLDVIDGQAIL